MPNQEQSRLLLRPQRKKKSRTRNRRWIKTRSSATPTIHYRSTITISQQDERHWKSSSVSKDKPELPPRTLLRPKNACQGGWHAGKVLKWFRHQGIYYNKICNCNSSYLFLNTLKYQRSHFNLNFCVIAPLKWSQSGLFKVVKWNPTPLCYDQSLPIEQTVIMVDHS